MLIWEFIANAFGIISAILLFGLGVLAVVGICKAIKALWKL